MGACHAVTPAISVELLVFRYQSAENLLACRKFSNQSPLLAYAACVLPCVILEAPRPPFPAMDPQNPRPCPFSSACAQEIRNSMISNLEPIIRQEVRCAIRHFTVNDLVPTIQQSVQLAIRDLIPTIRQLIREEMELAQGAPPRPPPTRQLRLQFTDNPPSDIFTDDKMVEQCGKNLGVQLLDAGGQLVTTGPESAAKLDVVALMGDFDIPEERDWSAEEFGRYVLIERGGKRPLLLGDLNVTLKEGAGTVGNIIFTDNSSWTKSKKFRLGIKVAADELGGVHIREGKTQAFSVKDNRGKGYQKHHPPKPQDFVWRLDSIGKDGPYHKRLNAHEIYTVQQFLESLVIKPEGWLKHVLGTSMPQKQYEAAVRHAKECEEVAGNHGVQPQNSNVHVNSLLVAEGSWDGQHNNYTVPVQVADHYPGQPDRISTGISGGHVDYNGPGSSFMQEAGEGHVSSKSASRWLKISMVFRCTISMKTAGALYRQRTRHNNVTDLDFSPDMFLDLYQDLGNYMEG